MSKRPTVPRGNCPDCGYRVQLLKDGAVQAHRDPRIPSQDVRCPGSWKLPKN